MGKRGLENFAAKNKLWTAWFLVWLGLTLCSFIFAFLSPRKHMLYLVFLLDVLVFFLVPFLFGIVKPLLFDIPRSILRNEYDVVPRSRGFAYLFAGALMLATGIVVNVMYKSAGVPLINIGLIFGGFIIALQGAGILLFRRKELGVLALIYSIAVLIIYSIIKWW